VILLACLLEVLLLCMCTWLLSAGCGQASCFSVNKDVACTSSVLGEQFYLSHLDMSDCERLTDCHLERIVSSCRQLSCLYLRHCSLVTDGGLKSVASHCLALTDISVAECRRITDAGVVVLAGRLGQSLAHVSFSHCASVGDRALACLAERCCRLRYVNARGCRGVTDCGVVRLATSRTGRRLRALDVSGCVGVGDAALRALARGCGAKLRRLAVRGCATVTDYGLLALALHCSQLRQLSVQDCPLVSNSALAAVRQHCQNCVIEHSSIDLRLL